MIAACPSKAIMIPAGWLIANPGPFCIHPNFPGTTDIPQMCTNNFIINNLRENIRFGFWTLTDPEWIPPKRRVVESFRMANIPSPLPNPVVALSKTGFCSTMRSILAYPALKCTRFMFAVALDLGIFFQFLSVFAVVAAVMFILVNHAATSGVCAFVFVCHFRCLLSRNFPFCVRFPYNVHRIPSTRTPFCTFF